MTNNVSVEDILAQLDKETLSMVRLGRDISTEIIPTASFGLNNILGGGLRVGKQHTIWGNEQSGKSALMMQTVALNQRMGLPCAWIDAEHSFDPVWAARLGIDVDKLAIGQPSTIGEVTDLMVKLIRNGMKLIVIDSTSALMPKSYVEDGELKPFANTGQMGAMAKDLGQMCKMVQGINFTCAVVHISQVRVDIGASSMQKPFKPVGGKEVEHTDSLRVRLMSSKAENKAIMGKVQRGDMLIEEQIGRTVTWKIDKNKINGRYGVGTYGLYTQGTHVGLDKASEVLEYAIKFGLVKKGGAWFEMPNGEKFQGEHKAQAYLRENEDILEKLELDINDQSI